VYLAMSDVHTLRTLFFVGDFSAVLNLISRKTLTPEPGSEDEEIATLKWRSLIAQGHLQQVINELSAASNEASNVKSATLLLAQFIAAKDEDGQVQILGQMESSDEQSNNSLSLIMTSQIYISTGQYEVALQKLLDLPIQSLEILSIEITCLLAMDAVPNASRVLENMKKLNPEAALTQLSQALIDFHTGNYEEAQQIYEDLTAKYNKTPFLLHQYAVALIHLGKYQDALDLLNESIAMQSYNPLAVSTLIGLYSRLSLCAGSNADEEKDQATYIARAQDLALKAMQQYPTASFVREIITFQSSIQAALA
ncbi:MAG: hypothetical protein EZS28_001530, partial [Streblomastix strix]